VVTLNGATTIISKMRLWLNRFCGLQSRKNILKEMVSLSSEVVTIKANVEKLKFEKFRSGVSELQSS
jgi:hypothetical protein